MDEVVASNVDGSFAEDEVQAVFGMGGMGKGNKKEMGAMGGKSAQQNLADVQKSLPGIDVGIDMPSVDLSAAQAELEKLWEQVTGLFKIVFGYLQVVSTLAVNLPSVVGDRHCHSSRSSTLPLPLTPRRKSLMPRTTGD